MTFAFMPPVNPDTPIDSVRVRRDLDSAPIVLRELAEEALRGNINMAELAIHRDGHASLPAQREISGDISCLGTAWLPRDTGALLSTSSPTLRA